MITSPTNNFKQLVADMAVNYPNQVHLEMYRHIFTEVGNWLASKNCHADVDYEHYTYSLAGQGAYTAWCFREPEIATLFALKWS